MGKHKTYVTDSNYGPLGKDISGKFDENKLRHLREEQADKKNNCGKCGSPKALCKCY